MEGKVPRPRGRPRKRQRSDDQNNGVSNNRGKRPVVEIKPEVPRSLLGRYVLKDFDDNGVFLGKVVSYSVGLYRVEYEDGDFEDLETSDLRKLIIEESYFDDELSVRRGKLDGMIMKKEKKNKEIEKKKVELGNEVEVSSSPSSEGECEDNIDLDIDATTSDLVPVLVLVPPVDLPSSSGTIGIPEEAVMNLLSVYGFLRSFSVQLYICPFGLDDFVGALNYAGPNSLLDGIHVALMRALKVHLERLSSEEGSEVASKCLTCIEWSLLDALTWPVYVVQYFAAMGHVVEPQSRAFNDFVVDKDYYSSPVGMKLKILQILCDDVFDVADLRAEIDNREESEFGIDPDGVAADLPEHGPRRVHPRFAKTSACKEKELSEYVESKVSNGVDENSDECRLCGMDGTLLCCDGCPLAYHSRCIGVVKMYIPDGPWYCPECTISKMGPTIAKKTSLRGAVYFGVDPHGRLFLGTCNHLLVLKISPHEDANVKYYNVTDIPKVVLALLSAVNNKQEYLYICKEISQYWDLPEGVISYLKTVETDLSNMQKEGGDEVSDMIKTDSTSTSQNAASASGGPVLTRASVTHVKSFVHGITHKGLTFKPQAYINHYTNGELAASAAATLAILLSEETHEPDAHKFSNPKKAAASNILLQMKAFSLVSPSFFWPSPDKKEITRERCGWCHSCQLTSASRRGCMLNAAVTGATKSAMKICSGLFPLKNGDGLLSSIAAYILYLEESLRGLISGPFLNETLRKQWRKKLEEAKTCKAIKSLLLELEENVLSITLSSEWLKLMDDWLIEHSISPSTPVTTTVATQKRGPGRRKQRSQVEVAVEGGSDDDRFTWWRGGRLSKVILVKAVLSKPKLRKAALQGGLTKFSEFNYNDGSLIPKRTRQSIWRSAVESSKNISQLALQVRYFDMNIRWSELVRPEQNMQDVKGSETEAAVFRNASIRDKRIVDNKVRYGVAFANQKHLPSRVMKNIIEVENETYWFHEVRVPLYLTKEYEESLHKVYIQPCIKKPSKRIISNLQRKQLKASRRADVFSFLASKRDNTEKCSCASCHLDVLLKDAATCGTCQGFSHKECTMSTTQQTPSVLVTCKRCYLARARLRMNRHPTPSPTVLINGQQQHQNPVVVTTPVTKIHFKPLINHQQASPQVSSSSRTLANTSVVIKQITPDSNLPSSKSNKQKTLSWGVIWKKKNVEDPNAAAFREENVLLASLSDQPNNPRPMCWLCKSPYNPGLTYVHCTNCQKWYHGEALRLEDSKITEVVGFKCCKCRRIRSPDCPYMDSKLREQKQMKKVFFRSQNKHGQGNNNINSGLDSDSERMSETKDSIPSTPSYPLPSTPSYPLPSTPSYPLEDTFVPEDDPLLASVSKVEQITPIDLDMEWNGDGSVLRPQKLQVRRQVKREETDVNRGLSWNTELEPEPFVKQDFVEPVMEWDTSGNNDELMFDYEDMEFEPQTYFSLTELLTADDSGGGLNPNPNPNPNPETEVESRIPIQCQICMHVDPGADLTCQTCNMTIHSHCSPWEEESSCSDGSWRCGRCREWL